MNEHLNLATAAAMESRGNGVGGVQDDVQAQIQRSREVLVSLLKGRTYDKVTDSGWVLSAIGHVLQETANNELNSGKRSELHRYSGKKFYRCGR